MRTLIIGGLVLCAVFFVVLMIWFWRFRDYAVDVSAPEENVLIYNYYPVGGNMLKCASDTAVLSNDKNENLWSVEYDMSAPDVDVCGSLAVIFDKGGTQILICNANGELGSFKTELPIVKARISSKQTVAVLLDDGTTAGINYYESDGDLIAAIKTTMTNDGYPMDIALSDDGETLGVSYLNFDSGMYVSTMCFYGFDAQGQTASDNIVGSYKYEGEIIPDVEFLSGNRFVAFGDNTLIVFERGKTIQELKKIEAEDKIESVISDEKYFGYVMQGNYLACEIVIYNSDGSERKRIESDFSYTSIKMYDDNIIMYNRNEMELYSVSGRIRYSGEMDSLIRQIEPFGSNRFALAATDGYYVIRLK